MKGNKSGGGRGDLLAAIKNGATLKKAEAAGSNNVVNSTNKYGEVIDGAWVMKKAPSGMDMFAEMNWKKEAKKAKEEWEATGATGQAGGGHKARAPAAVDKAATPASAPRLPPLPTVPAPLPPAPAPAPGPAPAPIPAPTPSPAAVPTPSMQGRPPHVSEAASSAAQAAAQSGRTPLALDGSLGGPLAIEQLKQELIAAFRAEIQTAKADILAEVKHMLDSR